MSPPAPAPRIIPVTVDGKTVMWNPATEPNPKIKGNESRFGFLWNPYFSSMGRFFQNTIKHGMWSVLHRIHDKEIPRYDKNAYEYADTRLMNLDTLLKGSIAEHVHDNDYERKQGLANSCVDITLFLCKEDVFYRARLFQILKDVAADVTAHPEMYTLTDEEQYNYERFQWDNYLGNKPILRMTLAQWREAKAKGEL